MNTAGKNDALCNQKQTVFGAVVWALRRHLSCIHFENSLSVLFKRMTCAWLWLWMHMKQTSLCDVKTHRNRCNSADVLINTLTSLERPSQPERSLDMHFSLFMPLRHASIMSSRTSSRVGIRACLHACLGGLLFCDISKHLASHFAF